MTRKDYTVIADTLGVVLSSTRYAERDRYSGPEAGPNTEMVALVIDALTDSLSEKYPNFDSGKFRDYIGKTAVECDHLLRELVAA